MSIRFLLLLGVYCLRKTISITNLHTKYTVGYDILVYGEVGSNNVELRLEKTGEKTNI